MCHQLLPLLIDTIDINQIRFTDSYQLINQYQFLTIDYSGFLLDRNALPFFDTWPPLLQGKFRKPSAG